MITLNLNLDVIFYGAWIVTAIFLVPVTAGLELVLCQFGKHKWLRIIPVVIGVAMSWPAAVLWEGRSIVGISGEWWILSGALVMSAICAWIGAYIWNKSENKTSNHESNE